MWIHRGRPLGVIQNAIRLKTNANEVVRPVWREAERLQQVAYDARAQLLRLERQWADMQPGGRHCYDEDWLTRHVAISGEVARPGLQRSLDRWRDNVAALQPQRDHAMTAYGETCQTWLRYIERNWQQLPNNYCGMTIQVEVRQGPGLPVLRLEVGHQFREGLVEALAELDEVHMPAHALEGHELQPPIGAELPQL